MFNNLAAFSENLEFVIEHAASPLFYPLSSKSIFPKYNIELNI
jgi:hypothetical protein